MIRLLALVTWLCVCSCSFGTTEEPGSDSDGYHYITNSELAQRVWNGAAVPIEQYPWQVGIFVKGALGQPAFKCGGSLIDWNWVITAAHCLDLDEDGELDSADSIQIGYGASNLKDLTKEQKYVSVEKTFYYPGNKSRNWPAYFNEAGKVVKYSDNPAVDLALIKLIRKIDRTNTSKPINVPSNKLEVTSAGMASYVSGWGNTGGNMVSEALIAGMVTILEPTKCLQAYNSKELVQFGPFNLCAGGTQSDACSGDSGGPLVVKDQKAAEVNKERDQYNLVGVVSSGPEKCGDLSTPGVYVDVGQFTGWIQRVIKDNSH